MNDRIHAFLKLLLVSALPFALAVPAGAQVQFVGYGAAEWDTGGQQLYVAGVGVNTTALGWGPAGTLGGYDVELSDEQAGERIVGISPSIGLQHRWRSGAVQARVGYIFVDADPDEGDIVPGAPVFGGGEDGVTTAIQGNYWGTTSRTQAEGIFTVNWGDAYVWGRARASRRITSFGDGGLNLGGEFVGQGNDDFNAFQGGPLVTWVTGDLLQLTGVVGLKTQKFQDDGPYFRAEIVIIP